MSRSGSVTRPTRQGSTFVRRVLQVLLLAIPVALATALVSAAPAQAQEPSTCEELVGSWAARCPAIRDGCVRGVVCPPGRVVLEAGCQPDARLRVEVSRATPRAFRKIGEVGLSPVGDFPDWDQVAEGKKRILDDIESCLANDPSLIVPTPAPPSAQAQSPAPAPAAASKAERPPEHDSPGTDPPVPWRLLLGLLLGLIVALGRPRNLRDRRTPALLGALFTGALVLRWLTFPAAFFHPNGQGAFWIGFALDENGRLASYGPGYRELHGWLAQLPIASPERLIIGAQAVIGALSPVCAWTIARGLGGSRVLAWGAGIAVATSPILARISQSQSYYATWTSLLFLAAAILVLGRPRKGRGLRRFGLAIVAAGLLVAQAARVTPIGWMSAAVLPLVVLAKPGRVRAQLGWAAVAALGIFAVVAATSGQAMFGVLQGALGAQWLPQVSLGWLRSLRLASATLPYLLVLVLASRHRGQAALRVLALLATLSLMDVTCLVRSDPESFQRAFVAMWVPVLLGLVASLVADLRTKALRALATGGLLAGAFAVHAATWPVDRELPTNVLEALWAEEWRERLPPGATVLYLGRVKQDVLALPLYGSHTRVRIEPWALAHEDTLLDIGQLGPDVYYYESSLCAASEARELCRKLRERHGLAPVETRTLPARSSAVTSFFEESTVLVTLYRIR